MLYGCFWGSGTTQSFETGGQVLWWLVTLLLLIKYQITKVSSQGMFWAPPLRLLMELIDDWKALS